MGAAVRGGRKGAWLDGRSRRRLRRRRREPLRPRLIRTAGWSAGIVTLIWLALAGIAGLLHD